MFFLFFMQLQQPAGKGDSMAKFLNYEGRLDIESGLKEHMTFTELGENLEETGLPLQRKSATIPSNRTPVMEVTRTIPASTEKHAGGKSMWYK